MLPNCFTWFLPCCLSKNIQFRLLIHEFGSPVLHPGALHFFMSLHPEGKNALHPKWHFIQYATTSPSALRPEWHFIPSILHLKGHFIPSTLHLKGHFISQRTSSHKSLHLTSHFIPYVTSSYRSLHPTGHFIPYVTSYYDSKPMSHLIRQVTSSQSTLHALSYFSTSPHHPIFHFIPDIIWYQ